ncbi:unnamed protein product [Absidia cylindrospora]
MTEQHKNYIGKAPRTAALLKSEQIKSKITNSAHSTGVDADHGPSLSRSLSYPKEKSKLDEHQKLRAGTNWKKIKQLAQRRRRSFGSTNSDVATTGIGDDENSADLSLLRRLEYNQLPMTLIALATKRDEKGLPRIPVLPSILKVRVNRINETKNANRKLSRKVYQLCVVVSYGSLQWTIYRRYWDFVKLHYSYCGYDLSRARRPAGLPAFPRTRLHRPHRPYRHRHRLQQQNIKDEQQVDHGPSRKSRSLNEQQPRYANGSTSTLDTPDRFSLDSTGEQSIIADDPLVIKHAMEDNDDDDVLDDDLNHIVPSAAHGPSLSSLNNVEPDDHHLEHHSISQHQQIMQQEQDEHQDQHHRNLDYDTTAIGETNTNDKYDKLLETYMMQLIGATLHSGNINRLCKFLEISSLGLHLKATQPQGYHGKEGYMVIVARTDHEPKRSRWKLGSFCPGPRPNHISSTQDKNTPKWFIIRENYMVCVNHPSDLDFYDVLLFEPGLQIQRGYAHHSISKASKVKVAITSAAKLSLGHSTLCIRSGAGEMYLRAKNVRQAIQFEQSLRRACSQSTWCLTPQRFNSFAPVRSDSPTTWFVDGSDYFWQISVALENAKKYIYIHDWWLSPELYLRRPPSKNQEWRLDAVLKRKAEQGVKVYVIVYKEVAMAVPLFSHYTKKHLLSLSNNIYVQRHPSRALDIFSNQGTLFYAHHEKICLVDGIVAFIGGLDLCFGRYDTARHILADDPSSIDEQIWVGKDYSNPRIEDFHALDKPFEDNINRSHLPRMPWHDISVRVCGEAAHDVEHHFVQRWNFLRRRKSTAPKRETPMLLPSSSFATDDKAAILNGTDPRIGSSHSSLHTQVQILRSISAWSSGVEMTEHSIMDAYVELIGASEHFIYIENQFFITSTQCGATVIENKVGDALYQRILRAFQKKENWHAVIMMPLVPEFPGTFDLADGTTIRLIMNSQYLSIGRGPDSLLGKLRAAGVTNTSHYIKFYGLRNWDELNGSYVTEQVYIHAKTMIVDDRTVVIGSANINERSILGVRDSEICACIEDYDMLDSTFGGQPVKVGRFAQSLRLRLMAEHMGLPIDEWDVDMLLDRARTNKETATKFKGATSQQQQQQAHGLTSPKTSTYLGTDAPPCHLPPAYPVKTPPLLDQQDQQDKQHQTSASQTMDQELKHTNTTISSEKSAKVDHSIMITTPTASTIDDEPSTGLMVNEIATTPDMIASHGYAMNEETLSLYKEWATWDTDTDNNGDGYSLVPLPLPLIMKSPDNDKTDDQETDSDRPPVLTLYNNGTKLTDDDTNDDHDFDDGVSNGDGDDGDDGDDNDDLFMCLRDPLTERWQHLWNTRARYNTDLFRRCFMVLPDNNIRTWAAYNHFAKMAKQLLGRAEATDGVTKHMSDMSKAKTDVRMSISSSSSLLLQPSSSSSATTAFMLPFVPHLLEQIKGHLVVWPARFMEDEGDDFVFAMDRLAPLEIFD